MEIVHLFPEVILSVSLSEYYVIKREFQRKQMRSQQIYVGYWIFCYNEWRYKEFWLYCFQWRQMSMIQHEKLSSGSAYFDSYAIKAHLKAENFCKRK